MKFASFVVLLLATHYSIGQCTGNDSPCTSLTATVTTAACASPVNIGIGSGCTSTGGSGGCSYQGNRRDVWVDFTIPATTDITIYLEPGNNRDVMIHLYDSTVPCSGNPSGSELACEDSNPNASGPPGSETLVYPSLPAGTYYVRAQALSSNFLSNASFMCVYGNAPISCQQVVSTLASSTPAAGADGIDVCQDEIFTLVGAGSYPENNTSYTQDDATSLFEWDFGDGNLQSGIGLTSVNHSYPEPGGGYVVQLTITDVMGCSSTNYISQRIRVSQTPPFVPISANQTICYGDQVSLIANAFDPTWTQSCTPAASDTLLLPDGAGGSYESTIYLSCFDPGQTLNDVSELWGIYTNLEHSWLGDLEIEVECPSGQSVIVKDYPGGGGTFLGEPVSQGSPDANSGDLTMGDGYLYSWTPIPTYGTMIAEAGNYQYSYTDNAGNNHTNQDYLPAGSYASDNPLTQLVGCELNGTWKLKVTDNLNQDNGYAFSFAVLMNPIINPPAWTWSNTIITEGWLPDPTIVSTTGPSITVEPDSPGVFPYIFETTDDFGCTNDTTITVTAIAPADAGTNASTNVCTGSGNLTLFNELGGTPDAGGSWTDDDATGALSGGVFDANAVANGTYDFTYTVTGTSPCPDSSATVAVTVGDVLAPVFTVCPSDASENTNASCQFTIPDYTGSATVTDNCDSSPSITQSPVAGTVISGYNTVQTITLTATDASGNSGTCTFDITLDDTIDPSITCPGNQTASFNGSCQYTLLDYTSLGSATDNCDATVTITQSPAASTVVSATTTITLTATDDAGNTDTCTFDVVLSDTTDPTITCPADVTVSNTSGNCNATGVALGSPVTADNCAVASTTNNAPGTYPVGTTTVTWTVTDTSGNTATCTQDVIVNDTEDPTITCPSDVSASADAGACAATGVALGSPVTADNCGVASVTNDAPASFPVGTTTVTWTVTDNSGNTATCTQDVVVTDDEDPTITCPSDVSVSADASSCAATGVALGSPVTADNCGVASTTNDAPASFPVGTTTVTWTVTDNSGNTASCTQDVTVNDTEDPTITCPADVSVNADGGSCIATGVALGSPVTADNCGVASVTNDAPASFPVGSTTVTWTVTDNAGNTATCTQDISVTDSEDPTITCPSDVSVSADAGACAATGVALGSPVTADNCGVASVTNDAPASFPVGTTTVTWTVTDNGGNTATCTQDVVVTDDEDPTITCPSDVSVSADASSCAATGVALGSPTTADNCGVASTTNDAPASFPLGTTTVTWTVTDNSGNTATCTQDVTVNDTEDPTITCPADVSVNADGGSCIATGVALGSPVTADNCGVASVTNDAPASFPVGSTTVTWTVTDNAGNTATCTQDISVTDSEDPTITCPSDVSVSADAGACAATGVALGSPVTADNCGVASVTNDAPASFPVGTTTVTWTVTDNGGNTATCTQDVVVTDDEDPTITCPSDVSVSADASSCAATGVALGSPTTADNCGVASTTNDAPASFPLGTTTVTWTVTDIYGNTATCAQDVIVTDDEDPSITCPGNQTESADAGCQFTMSDYTALVTSSDNCDPALTVVQSPAPATVVTGTTTVTMTVTDSAGNSSSCTFDVVITDTTDPVITVCPPDVTEQVDASCDFTLPDYTGAATATDNCDLSVTFTQSPIAGTVISGNGTVQTVTITATDDNGNSTTCTFDVTLQDSIDPTITCAADMTVSNDAGNCDANVTVTAPATADNCGVASLTNDFNGTADASGTYLVGTTTVVWTVTDTSGNTATCSQDITVNDTEDPTITCPADQTVSNDAGNCDAAVTIAAPATADNCGVASATNDFNGTSDASGTYPIGTTTVTWTVTDIYGNTATCTQDITVNDTEDPTITCPADVTVSNDAGNCSATGVALGSPATADNCGVASTTNDAPATFPVGTTTVTWTVTDTAGNTATCTQDVTVNDTEDPTITCPSDVTVSNDVGNCDATGVALGSPVAADNCGVASTTNDAPASFPLGTTTVTWTVTDIYGNTATCAQDVIVTDDEDPSITCPGNQTESADINCQFTMSDYTALVTSSDNCDPALTVVQSPAPATVVTGTTTVTMTVTDSAGNSSSCTFDVVITDTTDPTLSGCPSDFTQPLIADCDYSIIDYSTVVTASDNCDLSPSVTQTPVAGTIISGDGTIQTVVVTVTDANGNSTNCSFDITLEDSTAPALPCPSDVIVSTDAGTCGASLSIPIPAATDNCGIASLVNDYTGTNDASATYPSGVTTVNWTATDNSGNVSTCSFTITVNDDEDPTISCPSDQDLYIIGSCGLPDYTSQATISDNCVANLSVTQSPAAGTIISTTTTVTLTVTDVFGNSASCSFDVVPTDSTPPSISCPPNQILDLGN